MAGLLPPQTMLDHPASPPSSPALQSAATLHLALRSSLDLALRVHSLYDTESV